jgi:hypothetical protein
MTSNDGCWCSFRDEDHVIRFGESDESQNTPGITLHPQPASRFVAIINSCEEIVFALFVINDIIFENQKVTWWSRPINLEDFVLLV